MQKSTRNKVIGGAAALLAGAAGSLYVGTRQPADMPDSLWEQLKPRKVVAKKVMPEKITAAKAKAKHIGAQSIKISKTQTEGIESANIARIAKTQTSDIKNKMLDSKGISAIDMQSSDIIMPSPLIATKGIKPVKIVGKGKFQFHFNDWYKAYVTPPTIKFFNLEFPEKFRAVAEVCVPENNMEYINQIMELQFFKKQGFNTVLFTWQGEDVRRVISLLQYLKGQGWNVIWTHGVQETNEDTRFADLEAMELALRESVPYINAVMPLWRKASLPHYDTDEAEKRIRIIGAMVQKYGDLPVLGEYYYRLDGEHEYATPDNISGTVLQNVGYFNIMPDVILKKLNKENVIPVVVGPPPYYNSAHKRDYSKDEIWTLKQLVSDKYLNAGARGTITLVGDGFGEREGNTGRLTKSSWRKH
jgi:hypothetical protein